MYIIIPSVNHTVKNVVHFCMRQFIIHRKNVRMRRHFALQSSCHSPYLVYFSSLFSLHISGDTGLREGGKWYSVKHNTLHLKSYTQVKTCASFPQIRFSRKLVWS